MPSSAAAAAKDRCRATQIMTGRWLRRSRSIHAPYRITYAILTRLAQLTAPPHHDPGARAMAKSVLIIGPDPRYIDFSAPNLPPGVSAEKIIAGVDGARDRLADAGYYVQILLTRNEENVQPQVPDA